jgi:predicted O-methyltransferase YrrM
MTELNSILMDENNKETISDLIKFYNINCIIETGTNIGDTTEKLAINYPSIEIHTLEINKEFYATSSNRLSKYKNVLSHLGSSDTVLKELLPTLLNKRILFYLDAHWYDYWPLKNELLVISAHLKDNSIIIIDDISVPNLTPGMTGYYSSNTLLPINDTQRHQNVLSYNLIKTDIQLCYTNYIKYYNKPPYQDYPGKLYCIPIEWYNNLDNTDKYYIHKDIYTECKE